MSEKKEEKVSQNKEETLAKEVVKQELEQVVEPVVEAGLEEQVQENVQEEAQNEPKIEDLILGKFKTVEDLKTAYQNLQKQQGDQSEELGKLRKMQQFVQMITNLQNARDSKLQDQLEYINNVWDKYDTDNYLKNEAFKTLYTSAFKALGTDLDTDGFVDMLEKYVTSRLFQNEQLKVAESENNNVTDSLGFPKGITKKSEKKVRFQDLKPEEYGKYLAKYI